MRTRERTPTDATVARLDLSSLEEAMTEWYHREHGGTGGEVPSSHRITVPGPLGLVDTPDGAFVFDTDGVGAGPLPDDEPWELYGYLHTAGSFSVMPTVSGKLTIAELRERRAESVNLEHFIRTFGARLEANYEVMRRAIEEAGGAA